ncbi:MAG: COPII-coated vesicle [Lasallia pustulata]|uniref:Endoplasmic reticulum-Golgi intermediate compartment protein n=1 Tax=Lasallia pustulata TaxID=136370 RepID=A0A5M8PG84_9LECA|nr:MAG: COPII-coated vesicle [Lasallia pustulata]
MNGFADHGLDESAFGEKGGFTEGLRTFDAFPKTKPTYTRRSSTGGYTTLALVLISTILSVSEFLQWYRGHENQHFGVEKGVSHSLQINLDLVTPMQCSDIRINVQDASGDTILASSLLHREPTNWGQWADGRGGQRMHALDSGAMESQREEDTHVGHVLGEVGGRGGKRKFPKTPKLRGAVRDSCRVFGSLEGNKVQGDFHITARGHGYWDNGDHLDHSAFNFSHIINELSFGPFYPTLLNPLDRTVATTVSHFFKYQYYLSVVPTVYTRSPGSSPDLASSDTIFTNQYAVTTQSQMVGEQQVPGIFFKFDIEPILLTISEERGSLLALVVRVVNVVSGVLVGGGWCYQLMGWAGEIWGKKGGRKSGEGVLHGREYGSETEE